MRRGPNTTVCTILANWTMSTKTSFPTEVESCWNNQDCLDADINHRFAYKELRKEIAELKGRNSNKTRVEIEWEILDNCTEIMSEPCKVKHMSFYQHRKRIPDIPSCWWPLQFTEVFYNNPDCKTQWEDLPCSGQYPGHPNQLYGISLKGIDTHVSTRESILFWDCIISLMCWSLSV
jgi:hypothetical protein